MNPSTQLERDDRSTRVSKRSRAGLLPGWAASISAAAADDSWQSRLRPPGAPPHAPGVRGRANSRAIDIRCGEDVVQLLPLGLVQPLAQYEDRQGLFATTHVVGGRFAGGFLHSPDTELVVADLETKTEGKAELGPP